MNWKKAIADYRMYLKIERGLSESSIESYTLDVLGFEKFLIDENITKNPIDCDLSSVQTFIYETAKLLSPNTQARRLSGLRSFFDYMIFESYRVSNPTDLIEAPKLGRKLPDVLDLNEVDLLLEQIDLGHPQGFRNRAMLEMLYGSGIRVSELVNLSLSNLFFQENLIRVTGKGNKQRLVPMGKFTKKFILFYINNSRTQQNIDSVYQDIVFLNRNGKILTRQMIFTIIKQLALKADIKKKLAHTPFAILLQLTF